MMAFLRQVGLLAMVELTVVCSSPGPKDPESSSIGAAGSSTGPDTSRTSGPGAATSEAGPATGPTGDEAGSTTGSAATSTGASTTGEAPALCEAAGTNEACVAASELCRWAPFYTVEDLDTCVLSDAVWRCYAIPDGGAGGCSGFFPQACVDAGSQPAYRETGGVITIVDIQGPCTDFPQPGSGEMPWAACTVGEGQPAPAPCYCLCGGPPG